MWRRLEVDREDEFARWVQLSEELSDPGRPRSLYSEPVWLAGPERAGLNRVAVYEAHDALATFVVGRGLLPWYLGEFRLGSTSFHRATLTDLRLGERAGSSRVEALLSLLETCRTDLGSQVVFHVETHELGFGKDVAAAQADGVFRGTIPVPLGPAVRRFVRVVGDFQEYLGSLSGKTRHNVRRGRKRLAKELGGEPTLERVTEVGQIDHFLQRAQAVSRKTYQWNALGLGLRDLKGLRTTLYFAAELGWLRSYLLSVSGEPAAFIVGFQYHGTHQGLHHGYDPDLAKFSVGMLLWFAVLEDLFQHDPPMWFDFGSGDALYKRLLANTSVDAIQLHLWPRSWKNLALLRVYQDFNAITSLVSRAAERAKVKPRLKQFVRRWARQRSGNGS